MGATDRIGCGCAAEVFEPPERCFRSYGAACRGGALHRGIAEVAFDGWRLEGMQGVIGARRGRRPGTIRRRNPCRPTVVGGFQAWSDRHATRQRFCSALICPSLKSMTSGRPLPPAIACSLEFKPLSVAPVWTSEEQASIRLTRPCVASHRDPLAEFDKGELRGPVDGDKRDRACPQAVRTSAKSIGDSVVIRTMNFSMGEARASTGSLETSWRCKQRCNHKRVTMRTVG